MTSATQAGLPSTRSRVVPALAKALHVAAVTATLLMVVLLGAAVLPKVWGWSSLVVTSGSMQPTLSPGDVVLVQPVAGVSPEPLDIITFRNRDGSLTTHRIMDKSTDPTGTSFITKGDANQDHDPGVVDSRNVVGKVRYGIPWIGYLIAWARTPIGLGAICLSLLYVALGGRRKKGSAPATSEAVESDPSVSDRSALVRS